MLKTITKKAIASVPKTRIGAHKDFDYRRFQRQQNEEDYHVWMDVRWLCQNIHSLPENSAWNAMMCGMALVAIVILSMDYHSEYSVFGVPLNILADMAYNALFALHVIAYMLKDCYRYFHEEHEFHNSHWLWYLADVASYTHYASPFFPEFKLVLPTSYIVKICCYYIRLHRPFRFLWGLNDYYLKGSVIGTLFKYWYIFLIMRVVYANFFIWMNIVKDPHYVKPEKWLQNPLTVKFVRAFYMMDLLFLPIGPDSGSVNDVDRLSSLVVMISGALLVTGITIATLSIIVAVYMRSEELFRARFHLIMEDMEATSIPLPLRKKVETFYTMYWHKQRAVSVTHLLPTYPPTLESIIQTDIYFEAQQKSMILRNLSYQFLTEIAKHMETINYIPGDIIIRRNSSKFAMVYISYGDVEMLTADDDDTPMLRFTRGSILNPCGCCAEVAGSKAHVSIRAATFCTAHVLRTADLWRAAAKYGKLTGQNYILRAVFQGHLEKVKRHYANRPQQSIKSKSTILLFKRNIIELKRAKDEDGNLLLARTDIFLQISGCYVMRNRKDVSLTEDSDEICLRPTFPCILQPTSSLMLAWTGFVSIITLTVAYIHPYNLIYLKTVSSTFRFHDYMITFVYILDIIVHLSTGDKIEEGVPITFTQTSSQQIRSLWFVIDVIAAVPIFEFIGSGRFAGLNKLCKIPKVFRFLKNLEDVYVNQIQVLRFCAYFILLILMCWLVAALQQGYWCFRLGKCLVTNFTHAPYWAAGPLDDGPVEGRISYSLYWAVSVITFTVHKTAVVSKVVWANQFFMMVLLEVCTVSTIIVSATYSATIMVAETLRDQYNMCIRTVKQFMVKNSVDPVLRERFINYLQLCWYTDKAYQITSLQPSIYFDLPNHVYRDLAVLKRNKYILSIPFMKYLRREDLKYVCSQGKLFSSSPNEILLNTGDITNEIYVIRQGVCEIVNPDTKEVVSIISDRKCFGDLECLMRLPTFYTVRAVTHVKLYSISRRTFLESLSTPKFIDAIQFTKQQPEYGRMMRNRREQFLQYKSPPCPPSRVWFPLPRRHDPDVAFLQPFKGLGFFAIFRYIFPRWTIRPDGTYIRRYEWFRAFCAFLSANIFPMYALLVLQFPCIFYFCWFLDFIAYFDIVQRMLLGYYNENGILVYHPASTAAHYLKGALLLDLISCLPLEFMDSVRQRIYFQNNAYRRTRTAQLLMYNRLGQLYRVPNALGILNDYIDRQDIVLLIKSIPIILALLVVVTSMLMEFSVMKWSVVGGGWRLQIIMNDDHGSWLINNADVVRFNMTESPINLILATYYWVVYEITSTGLNLYQPSSLSLINIILIGMLVGAIVTTYFSVRVLSIRSNVKQALASYQENMKDIVTFMQTEKLDSKLQREVVSYYEYTWEKTGGMDYRSVLKFCEQITLRTDAILEIYGPTFNKCPVLANCEVSLLRLLGRAVHSVYFRQGMTVIEREDVIADMYFVDYGSMEARDPFDDDVGLVRLPRGSVFGNLDNTSTVVCPNRFVANSNLQLLKLDTMMYYGIVQDFPSIIVLMEKYRAQGELNNYIIGSIFEDGATKLKALAKLAKHKRSVHSVSLLKKGRKHPLLKALNSHSKGVQIYLILVSMMCVYADLYNAGFHHNGPYLIAALYALDFAFFLKIVLNFALPYISDEESKTRAAVATSRKRYMKSEFKYDVLSLLPIELVSFLLYNPWSVFSFLRLNRLLRIVTVDRALERYHQNLSINLTVSTIWSVFIWFTLFVHTTSCIWYYLGVLEDHNEAKSSWRYDGDGNNLCYDQYLCSVYFILTTFTQNGVGDLHPRQESEVVFVTILMILSTLMYMGYVGRFSDIIQYQYFRCLHFYSDYLQLKEFLKNNRVSQNLVTLTKKYTLHLWREGRGLQKPQFLDAAPQCLRLKIMCAAYMKHLKAHPTFKHSEPAFRRQVVGFFQPYYYDQGMYVVREGEITNSMYFVHKGRVQQMSDDESFVTRIYEAGENFGTRHGVTRDLAYCFTYKTVIKSEVLTLHFDDWEYLLKYFKRASKVITQVGDKYTDRRTFAPRASQAVIAAKRRLSMKRQSTAEALATAAAVAAANAAAATAQIDFIDSRNSSMDDIESLPLPESVKSLRFAQQSILPKMQLSEVRPKSALQTKSVSYSNEPLNETTEPTSTLLEPTSERSSVLSEAYNIPEPEAYTIPEPEASGSKHKKQPKFVEKVLARKKIDEKSFKNAPNLAFSSSKPDTSKADIPSSATTSSQSVNEKILNISDFYLKESLIDTSNKNVPLDESQLKIGTPEEYLSKFDEHEIEALLPENNKEFNNDLVKQDEKSPDLDDVEYDRPTTSSKLREEKPTGLTFKDNLINETVKDEDSRMSSLYTIINRSSIPKTASIPAEEDNIAHEDADSEQFISDLNLEDVKKLSFHMGQEKVGKKNIAKIENESEDSVKDGIPKEKVLNKCMENESIQKGNRSDNENVMKANEENNPQQETKEKEKKTKQEEETIETMTKINKNKDISEKTDKDSDTAEEK